MMERWLIRGGEWYTTIPELETLVQKTPLSVGALVVKVRVLRRNCIATAVLVRKWYLF